ncbi:MAG: DUF2815 family protein [Hyphomicrobiales bacterium]|nr:DUF2815 family protein [Hyphomicrobiales bacterium]
MTQYQCKKLDNGNVRTCEVRLSFPNLFKAVSRDEDKVPKRSAAILFPRGADIAVLKQAVADCAKETWGDKIPKGLRLPFRDQGEKDFEGYEEGCVFFNASSTQRIPVVDRKLEPIVDEEDVYPGIWAIVTLRAFPYGSKKGSTFSPGIGFGLQAVQIVKDGERLGGGRADPNEEFETLPDLEEGESADAVFNGTGVEDPLAALGLDD